MTEYIFEITHLYGMCGVTGSTEKEKDYWKPEYTDIVLNGFVIALSGRYGLMKVTMAVAKLYMKP